MEVTARNAQLFLICVTCFNSVDLVPVPQISSSSSRFRGLKGSRSMLAERPRTSSAIASPVAGPQFMPLCAFVCLCVCVFVCLCVCVFMCLCVESLPNSMSASHEATRQTRHRANGWTRLIIAHIWCEASILRHDLTGPRLQGWAELSSTQEAIRFTNSLCRSRKSGNHAGGAGSMYVLACTRRDHAKSKHAPPRPWQTCPRTCQGQAGSALG